MNPAPAAATILDMVSDAQQTRFVGYRDSGDEFVHMELNLNFDNGQAPEWIAEELPGKRFQRWRRHDGLAEPGVSSYLADASCGEHELVAAGYADCLRVRHPDTVL